MTFSEVRKTTHANVRGGVAAVYRHLIKTFRAAWAHGQQTIEIAIGQETLRVSADINRTIQDEAGECEVFGYKGSAGIKCCWSCANCTDVNHERAAHDRTGLLVDVRCNDPSRFLLHTNASIFAHVETLRAHYDNTGRAPPQLESDFGINFLPDGILADVELREVLPPVDTTMRDPAHLLILNGRANWEIINLCMSMESKSRYRFADLNEYCTGMRWQCPQDLRIKPSAWFSKERVIASTKAKPPTYKGGGSEVLASYRRGAQFFFIYNHLWRNVGPTPEICLLCLYIGNTLSHLGDLLDN